MSTWLRVAPIVRSVASSRVRWAIVIESVFAITNAPTKSATKPNASRNFCRNERNEVVSLASCFACCSPVFTCAVGGRIAWISARSLGVEIAAVFETRIWSSWPSFWNSVCAVGRSKIAMRRAADRRDAAELGDADDAERLRRAVHRHADLSARPGSRACRPSPLSIAISFGAAGQRPATSFSGLKSWSRGLTLKPRFGAPPVEIDLPLRPTRWVWSYSTPPTASWTPGQALDLGEQRLRNRGRGRVVRVAERRLAADDRVGVLVRDGEDRVEALLDRVGEDVGARHHRDAEDDRERGQHGAQLAPGESLERDPDHAVRRRSG